MVLGLWTNGQDQRQKKPKKEHFLGLPPPLPPFGEKKGAFINLFIAGFVRSQSISGETVARAMFGFASTITTALPPTTDHI